MRTRILRRSGILGVALCAAAVAVTSPPRRRAAAASIYAGDCSAMAQSQFCYNQRVCAMGDVDHTCPVGPIELPAADLYVVPTGAPPFSGQPVHVDASGGFGSFWGIEMMLPPLAAGVYDLILDERCDGVWDPAEDIRTVAAFTVDPVCGSCQCPDPGGPPIQSTAPGAGPCFGACGEGCRYCTSSTVTQCIDSGISCEHCDCAHEEKECEYHSECEWHDNCLANCNVAHPGGGKALAACQLKCHAAIGVTHLPGTWWAWLHGHGGTSTITFSGPAAGGGPLSGPCGGGSC